MPRRFIQSMVARRSSSTDRSMPLRADSAWRRNWITETPGISCGYWNARNMPALARTSVGQSVMSSPWKTDAAVGDLVLGAGRAACWPRVLLPEPFGPMMACTSPAFDRERQAAQDLGGLAARPRR